MGKTVIVLDPLKDVWDADLITKNNEEFLQAAKSHPQMKCFVDESGQAIGRYNQEMEWLATTARHWGHQSFFITQRPAQLSKTVRDQCYRAFIFRVSKDDADTLAAEFCEEELKNCSSLERFHYYEVGRFVKPVKKKLQKP